MTYSFFHSLLASAARKSGSRTGRSSQTRHSFVPQLLELEDRSLLSVLTVLNNADSGTGSLRAAIAAAQSGDTIVFDPSLMHETISLSSGPLDLSSNLRIHGPGAHLLAISGNNANQLFTLSGSAQVSLANLTLTGGMSSQGGAVFIGGSAALMLDSDVLSGNQAVGDTNGNALGGAVYNSAGASLTIDNTSFVNNQTNGKNNSFGGAIANAGTLAITGATFTGDAALGSIAQGGAICNLDGSAATISHSSFAGNQALGNSADSSMLYGGGAIEANPGSNLVILNCSFSGNQVNNSGGAAASGGAIDTSVNVHVTISGSQFIDNSSIASGVGAQAFAGAVDDYQTMTIDNCLFTGNRAVGGPMADGVNTFGQGIGGAIRGAGPGVILSLSNSIVADNQAIGGSDGSTLPYPRTDGAFGGGIAFGGQTLNVTGCTITGNQALGGAVASGSGAPAFGGGILNNVPATLNLMDSTVSTNLCQGGAGASGAAGGLATGGGIANARGGIALLTNCTLSLNVSQGGVGGAGANGGFALGGAISNAVYAFAYGSTDASSLVVSDCLIVGNTAQGGIAGSNAVGGDGLGGGIFLGSGTGVLRGVLVSGNQSQGGIDSQQNTSGNGLGGGVYVDPSATATMNAESIIASNQATKSNNDIWGTITTVP